MMLFKTKNLKLISKFLLLIIFLNQNNLSAQSASRIKVDGVASVIGDFVILDSDIDRMYVEMESQGMTTKDVSRCDLISKLMED